MSQKNFSPLCVVLVYMDNQLNNEMSREFIALPSFLAKWRKIGFTDDDMIRLERELCANPKVGAVLRGTNGARKMRFSFLNQGKSGSARVIYVDFEVSQRLYFVNVFAKSEQENISAEERNELKKVVELLELEN